MITKTASLKDYTKILLENSIFGDFIRMEASTLCQLKCPACIQGNGRADKLGKGYLKYRDFKKFIEENPYFRNIELSNYGEIFLNPELRDIIEYAYQKKINLQADNGVNLNTVNKETLEYLVKYKFKLIRVSIDGASNQVYQIYRIGGNFNQVIENIKTINHFKKKYNSQFPLLIWQFIIFGHSEHELIAASKMAQSLNMQFIPKFNWDAAYSPIRNTEFVRKIMGFSSRAEHDNKTDKLYMNACTQFWLMPQINWDGRILGCCVNYWTDFGNVFEAGLKSCMHSERYSYAKKMLLGLAGPREDMPCYNCFHYKEISSKNQHSRIYSLLESYLINYFKRMKSIAHSRSI
jgi:MoaA/NifB/PqqE/SkfB family radical SAM enzyme